jgi:hypothetical protein
VSEFDPRVVLGRPLAEPVLDDLVMAALVADRAELDLETFLFQQVDLQVARAPVLDRAARFAFAREAARFDSPPKTGS